MNIIEEKTYDILQNSHGELLFVISVKEGNPVKPRLCYACGEEAILFHSVSVLFFRGIHHEVQPVLAAAKKILVTEVENGNIVREYEAAVSIMPKKALKVFSKTFNKEKTLSERIKENMKNNPEFSAGVMQYYNIMADNGNADAQYEWGLLLFEGEYVQENYELALDYLLEAAEQGHKRAETLYLSETAPDDDGRYDAWS